MSWLGTLFGVLAVLGGYTAQNVTIVYWTDASVNAYGILLICGCFFGAVFGLALLGFALLFRDPAATLAKKEYCEAFPTVFGPATRWPLR